MRARSLADELALGATGATAVGSATEDELRAQLTSQQLRLESRIQRQDADEADTVALRHSIEETRAQLDANRVRSGGVAAQQTVAAGVAGARCSGSCRATPPCSRISSATSSSHAWLLTRQRAAARAACPGRDALQQRHRRGGDRAQRGGAAGGSGERELGAMLFGSLLDGVHETRMLVLADGPLNGVPFAALPVPGAGGGLLIDRFVLGYAPSLALAMDKARPAKSRNTRVAVVSDPVYARRRPPPATRHGRRRRHPARRAARLA